MASSLPPKIHFSFVFVATDEFTIRGVSAVMWPKLTSYTHPHGKITVFVALCCLEIFTITLNLIDEQNVA